MTITKEIKQEILDKKMMSADDKFFELATIVRLAGSLHIIKGNIVVEIEVDSRAIADRVISHIKTLYGFDTELLLYLAGSLTSEERYVVRVINNGLSLAMRTGLLDRNGRPITGLPAQIMSAGNPVLPSILGAAFLARGSLSDLDRSPSLEITATGTHTALGLMGIARRAGIVAKVREVRDVHKFTVRDPIEVARYLLIVGAKKSLGKFIEAQKTQTVRAHVNRIQNFDNANLRRTSHASVTTSQRIARAFEILEDDEMPTQIKDAGTLRLEHKDVSLEELGKIAVPPISKDAIAGRIRRLLSLADKKAHDNGLPDTRSRQPDFEE
jgi:DNA-binding protein WhiA